MRKKVIISFLLLLGSTKTVYANIATVSTTKQLTTAINVSQPGDVIELADGVYQINTVNGIVISDKSGLTIRSQSGNRDAVILQGKGIDNSSTQFIFKLYRSPFFTLCDLTMKYVYWHHIQINSGSHHFTLRNLVMLDAGEGPVKITSPGGMGPFSDYGLIENSWLGFTSYGTRDVVEGIDIIASVGTVVRNCEFYRIKLKDNPHDVGWGVFAKCNAQDTVIENNYFEDNDIAISFGNGGCPSDYARYGDATYQHRRGIIRNNIVNRTKDNAIYINSAKDFKIYNNTLWSTYNDGGNSIDIRFNSNGKIFNNITNQGYRLRNGGTATVGNNIWKAKSSIFRDQPNGNFHLAPTAIEAIDQGVDSLADVSYDMDWQSRPKGSKIDIGADEY
jgi:hypothetical protein